MTIGPSSRNVDISTIIGMLFIIEVKVYVHTYIHTCIKTTFLNLLRILTLKIQKDKENTPFLVCIIT